MSTIILSALYLIHLVGTVIWLGGLAMLVLVAWPALSAQPDSIEAEGPVHLLERRLRPYANISLIALLMTGMVQMGANPNYEGVLQFGNAWSVAMLAKHIVFAGMVLLSAIEQFALMPELDRALLLASRGDTSAAIRVRQIRGRLRLALVLMLALGLLVLLFTAVMTAL
ncbi:MAG: CopD family protein [Anaerolineae bacterium]|nr:CopD family protein [Anaerolineae bacterium]